MTTQLLASARSSYVLSYEVVATHPHDHSSFTQGLTFDRNSTLYESVGLYGESDVRTVDLASGAALRRTANAPEVFGEGLALAGDALIQLSWRENKVFEYDAASLAKKTTGAAISAGRPQRPTGVRPHTLASNTRLSWRGRVRSVSMYPGPTQFTVTPSPPSSAASDFVRPAMACLDATYACKFSRPTVLMIEPMLMIRP
mgnify:CR=1 FL=1